MPLSLFLIFSSHEIRTPFDDSAQFCADQRLLRDFDMSTKIQANQYLFKKDEAQILHKQATMQNIYILSLLFFFIMLSPLAHSLDNGPERVPFFSKTIFDLRGNLWIFLTMN